jgi:glyoxylase-like metal-dependent hydrolase (beta-lactamase superfamily II)
MTTMTLVVDCYELGPLQTNCFVVRSERGAKRAVVVDPGGDVTQLRLELARIGARCEAILVTHGHWDHVLGVADLADATGARVYMSAAEQELIERDQDELMAPPLRAFVADVQPSGGEHYEEAGLEIEAVACPGHRNGHLAYLIDGRLFSGDVLFRGSIGRTDLPGGDWEALVETLAMLAERFPPETVLYPGHGPETTLGAELATNPFLSDLRAR